MITKRVVRFLLVVAFSITIGLWGWLTWRSSIVGASPSPGSPEALGVVPAFLATSADGRIQYGYGVELPTRFAGATVEYDAQTVAGIEQYVTFNQTELERLLAAADERDNLPIVLTFNRPLTQIEFEEFVSRYQVVVKAYIIWIDNSDGTTTTIQGSPSVAALVPPETLNYVLSDVEIRGGDRFLGWVEVRGQIPVGRLKEMAADSEVFLIDVMDVLIQEHFTEAVLKEAGISYEVRKAVLAEGFQMLRPPLAAMIRDLGLMDGVPDR